MASNSQQGYTAKYFQILKNQTLTQNPRRKVCLTEPLVLQPLEYLNFINNRYISICTGQGGKKLSEDTE